jgi:hypothetical protein
MFYNIGGQGAGLVCLDRNGPRPDRVQVEVAGDLRRDTKIRGQEIVSQ